ncbi:MAG: SAM-dependent methyltransferase [Microthrixaceae bacterium]
MADPTEGELPDGLAEAFDHLGRLRFDQYMELALYAPATGFFATRGGAGRREGDFITSPEVGPLFGSVVASHLDELWDRLDRPDPFTVVEGGAGRGALAISARAASPRCSESLHWVMVERSAALRSEQARHLDPVPVPGGARRIRPVDGPGPHFYSAAELPEGPFVGAVVANELLDNIPCRLMEHTSGGWRELQVERGDDGPATLAEHAAPVEDRTAARLDELVADPADGARVPWQELAATWVAGALGTLERGELIVFDYVSDTPTLASRPQEDWLRTYRSHGRGSSPLDAPGTQDITVEVARDQLPPGWVSTSQAEWLRSNGLDELLERARTTWADRAGVGDLVAMRARSAPLEAEALTEETGLGGFEVLTWSVTEGVAQDPSTD